MKNIPQTVGKVKATTKHFVDDMLDLSTLDKCTYTYNNAEQYYEAQKETVVSIIRGKALVAAKLRIVEDSLLLYVPIYKLPIDIRDKWMEWLRTINGTRTLTNPYTRELQAGQIDILFKFMEVRETTAVLSGDIIPIPNSWQNVQISDALGRKQGAVTIIQAYSDLAKKYNKGEEFNSAADLKKALDSHILEQEKAKKEIAEELEVDITKETNEDLTNLAGEAVGVGTVVASAHVTERVVREDAIKKLQEAFIEEHPEYEEEPESIYNNPMEVCMDFSQVTKEGFKIFVKEVSKVIHADKGGNDEMQTILNTIRDAVKESNVFKSQEIIDYKNKRVEAFRVFVGDQSELFGNIDVEVWLKA